MTDIIKADDLNYRYLRATVVSPYYWNEDRLGEDIENERWQVVYPSTADVSVEDAMDALSEYGVEFEEDEDDESLCDKLADAYREHSEDFEPVMNFYIDIDDEFTDPEELATKLFDTCLGVAIVDDRTVLTLLGGGMDMTWEICEAFMKLGSVPPLTYCRLPGMAGRGTSPKDLEIIAACNKALTAAIKGFERDIESNSNVGD